MLEHLKSISKNHSISRAVATIFIAQPILKPELIFEKFTTMGDFQDYQRKTLSTLKTISLDMKDNVIAEGNSQKVNGFSFESFDERGRLKNIFRLLNGDGQSKTTLTFETRLYDRWDPFLKKLLTDFRLVAKEYNFFIEAIGLTYMDEFDWKSDIPIDISEIFDSNSDLVNQKFLSSKNGSISLLSQNDTKTIITEEKAEIGFSNNVKKIIITHQYAIQFRNLEISKDFLDTNAVVENFNEAHNVNKEFLRNLLTKQVQEFINLN